jgi:SAM-dependent methyltransferase
VKFMDLKAVKYQILHGSIARRVLYRSFLFASVMSIIPLLHILSGSDFGTFASLASTDCAANLGFATANMVPGTYFFHAQFLNPIWGSFESVNCKENVNLTIHVVRELVDKKMLKYNARALCVGEGSAAAVLTLQDLGFSNAGGVYRHRFFSLKRKQFVHELDYLDDSFDFVLSRDVDKVSVPALLVLEIERVLSPGGIGAMLVGGVSGSIPNSLIRSATPVSSLLKSSDVVHVGYVHNYTLVVFKKRFQNAGYLEQYCLPADCQSITNNKPFMDQIEPLVELKPVGFEKRFSYLPKLIDVDTRKRLVYIDIGAGLHLNSNAMNWFLPSYPLDRKAFSVYFVDHNTSVLLSLVKKPGITFVYHPGLAGNKASPIPSPDEDIDPPLEIEGFNFLSWFKETVQYADFVVLKMNAGKVELKFLSELFESGAICFVDEMFLHCSDSLDAEGAFKGEDCMGLFKGLRSRGVFVHQWWGD